MPPAVRMRPTWGILVFHLIGTRLTSELRSVVCCAVQHGTGRLAVSDIVGSCARDGGSLRPYSQVQGRRSVGSGHPIRAGGLDPGRARLPSRQRNSALAADGTGPVRRASGPSSRSVPEPARETNPRRPSAWGLARLWTEACRPCRPTAGGPSRAPAPHENPRLAPQRSALRTRASGPAGLRSASRPAHPHRTRTPGLPPCGRRAPGVRAWCQPGAPGGPGSGVRWARAVGRRVVWTTPRRWVARVRAT